MAARDWQSGATLSDFEVDDGSDEEGIIPELDGRHGNFPPPQDP